MRVVDLFAGVGGLSLGAARAGFQLGAAFEWDEQALAYHALNFPQVTHSNRDIATLSGEDLLAASGARAGERIGLIGGPPCQGFSDMGKKDTADPRNELLVHFFRLVREVNPSFFVAENVPGLMNERNAALLSKALSFVPKHYSVLPPFIAKASDYGAPTIRTRVFLIGYDPELVGPISPADFAPHQMEDVRVGRALLGLPAVRSHWATESESWRKVTDWGVGLFEERLKNAVPQGAGDPAALKNLRNKGLVSGFLGTIHSEESIRRFKLVRPGKSDPISKCHRLSKDGYCPTLRAGTGPDRGSHQALRPIHPSSPRVITPREAARLQGFPDWFQFHPTKWHAFRQIGNSVSPIVAEFILKAIYRSFN